HNMPLGLARPPCNGKLRLSRRYHEVNLAVCQKSFACEHPMEQKLYILEPPYSRAAAAVPTTTPVATDGTVVLVRMEVSECHQWTPRMLNKLRGDWPANPLIAWLDKPLDGAAFLGAIHCRIVGYRACIHAMPLGAGELKKRLTNPYCLQQDIPCWLEALGIPLSLRAKASIVEMLKVAVDNYSERTKTN